MKRSQLVNLLIWGLVLPFACNAPDNNALKTVPVANQYIDIAGFVQSQVNLLNQEKPAAEKTVIENGRTTERKTLTSLNWQKELESFIELDINKPAFRNAYSIVQKDSAGYNTQIYELKPESEGDVILLAVTKDPQKQVREIRAIHQNRNVLINTRQEMKLTCYTKAGQNHVQSYQIAGSQNPILFDSLQYAIFTQIR